MKMTYSPASAKLQERWAAEREAKAQQEAQQAAEQERQRQEAEQIRLQELRQRRLTREAVEGMDGAELDELERLTDPDQAIRQLYQETRQEQEAEFLRQMEAEYNAELIALRNEAVAGKRSFAIPQQSRDRGQAEANKRAKIEKFYADREARELAAEQHDNEAVRLVSSLDDNGIARFREKWHKKPQASQMIATAKQTAQSSRLEGLTSQYVQEMGTVKQQHGYIPTHLMRQIKDKYSGLGLNPNSNDVVIALTRALGR
jgi:hypothetical protein